MAKATEQDIIDIFSPKNEVKPQSINWGKVGDHVFGVKAAQRDNVNTRFGKNSIYSMKVNGGVFHQDDGSEVQLKPGDMWDVWGRNDIFDAQLSRMQIGQKFGLKLVEIRPSTKGHDAKIIKVFTTGEIDEAFLESLAGTGLGDTPV